jgi:hypothetical protein
MPDETVTIRGGSLTIQCHGGGRFREETGPHGSIYHHPNPEKGEITSVEIFDQGSPQKISIQNPKSTRIVIHYNVPVV